MANKLLSRGRRLMQLAFRGAGWHARRGGRRLSKNGRGSKWLVRRRAGCGVGPANGPAGWTGCGTGCGEGQGCRALRPCARWDCKWAGQMASGAFETANGADGSVPGRLKAQNGQGGWLSRMFGNALTQSRKAAKRTASPCKLCALAPLREAIIGIPKASFVACFTASGWDGSAPGRVKL